MALAVLVLISSLALASGFQSPAWAQAPIPIRLVSPADQSGAGQEALQTFVLETASRLPLRMAEKLTHPIRVEFAKLNAADLLIPFCAGEEAAAMPVRAAQMRGKAITSKSSRKPHRIILDQSFIREILAGESGAQTYPCGHRNLYRLAQATLIHEIGHLYDNLGPLNEDERDRYDRCVAAEFDTNPDRLSDPSCLSYRELEKAVSSRPAYQQLASWKAGVFDAKAKNKLRLRSPDPYEYKNIREHFAVNLEYFLLDPQYACRRPALNQYLVEHFGGRPFPVDSCEPNNLVYLSSSNIGNDYSRFVRLDPSRVYQVHYLLAGKGEEMMSRWGHAMLRLVICAPERAIVGPECLNDLGHHLVISFRANVTDMILNAAKGMFGGYPSQLFIYRLSEIIQEYTDGELRELRSAPLLITPREKDLLVSRALEQSWEYSGSYYFLTNNCATEVLDLLKGILPDERIRELSPLSPLGLYDGLAARGVTDLSPFGNIKSARRKGYYFESKAGVYVKNFATIKALGIGFKDWKKFEEQTIPEERRALFVSLSTAHPELRERLAAAFYTLENYANFLAEDQLQTELTRLLERFSSGDTDGIRRLDALEKLVTLLGAKLGRAPWKKLGKGGYGIPLPEELSSIPLTELAEVATLNEEVISFLHDNIPGLAETLDKIASNRKFFKSAITGKVENN